MPKAKNDDELLAMIPAAIERLHAFQNRDGLARRVAAILEAVQRRIAYLERLVADQKTDA